VPPSLLETTVRIATSLRFGEVAAGMIPVSVSSIIEGGRYQMLPATLKIGSLSLLIAGGIAASVARQVPDTAGPDARPGVSSSPAHPRAVMIEVLPRSPEASPPGSVKRVREILESAAGHTAWHRRFSMKVKGRSHGPRRLLTEAVIRKDGSKIDYQCSNVLVGQPAGYPGNTTDRSIDDGASWLARTTSVGREKLTGARTVAKRESDATRAFAAWTYGFALDGYLAGNQRKSLVEILAATPQLIAKEEAVDGVRCLRVSADTEYGDVAVWLDPASDYCLRKATLFKERGHRYDDSRLGEHVDTVNLESFEVTVSEIGYSRVGRHLIPCSGKVNFTQVLNGQPPERWTILYTRSEINLDPKFEGTDAFKMDFADGARITDLDAHGRDHYYLWRNGDLIPQIDPQRRAATP
jgi:hypothetical protein